MKIICFLLHFIVLNSLDIEGSSFFIMKYYPISCGELTQLPVCMVTSNKDYLDLERRYFASEGSQPLVAEMDSNFASDLRELNNIVNKTPIKKQLENLTDKKFYIELIIGFNGEPTNSLKIYGALDCILFLERLIMQLESVNSKNFFIDKFRSDQEIITFDRLCKCSID